MDGVLSPVLLQVDKAIDDYLTNSRTSFRAMARLRTEGVLSTAEEGEDEEDQARRPVSMSSLTSHLELTRSRVASAQDTNREADEDSTMVSNLEFLSPVRRKRTKSTSLRSSVSVNAGIKSSFSSDDTKGVSFGSVSVREYERTIGDNPSCSTGVPIGLNWAYCHYLDVDVDVYESSVRKPSPRTRQDFYLSPQDRVKILRDECGCSPQAISRAHDIAAEVRDQRKEALFGESPEQRQKLCSPVPESQFSVQRRPAYNKSKGTVGNYLQRSQKVDNRWDA